jgi:uncharacterized protein (TIGR02246 family)
VSRGSSPPALPATFQGRDVAEEQATLRAFVRSFLAAWNRHDAQAMASCWMAEGDLLNTRGHFALGREAIEQMLAEEHSTSMRHSRAEMVLTRIRFLPGRIVHADARMTLTGVSTPDGRALPPLRLNVAFIAMRMRLEGWRYVLVRPYSFLTGF